MSTRQVATTAATLAVGFLLGVLAWQPSWAQRKAEEAAKAQQKTVGRYQIAASRGQAGGATVWAVDTSTGQVWFLNGDTWQEKAKPIQVPEK